MIVTLGMVKKCVQIQAAICTEPCVAISEEVKGKKDSFFGPIALFSRVKELGKQKLIPGILEARQTPMHAIRISNGICQLLGSQRAPLLLVDRSVRILAIARELSDVEESDGDF